MKKEKIRVLVVEDNEDDFELVKRELQKGNYEIEYDLVEDEKGLNKALKKKWDIIISDYALPNFNGYEALKICNKKELDIPFIIVSGTVGEDLAVEMMKAGCKDYIMKKSLKRLLPAVERELVDAKIRKKNKLIALEREALFAIGKDIMNTNNLDELLERIYESIKKVIYAENCFIALFDSEKNEISFPFFKDKYDSKPAPMKKRKTLTDYVIRTGNSLLTTPEILNKLNKEKEIELIGTDAESWLGVPLIIQSKPIGALVVQSYEKNVIYNEYDKNFLEAIAKDIAVAIERRKAIELIIKNEEQLNEALKIANAGHWEYDIASDTFTFNDNFYRIFRTTAKEVGGYKMSPVEYAKRFLHPDDMILVKIENEEALSTNDPNYSRQLEHRIIFPNGEVGYISVIFHIEKDANGRTIRTYGINQDITERKKQEEALRKTENHFRSLIEKAPDGVVLISAEGKFKFVSNSAKRIFGYELDLNYENISPEENTHPDDLPKVLNTLNDLISNPKKILTIQYRFRHKTGKWIWIQSTFSNLLDDPSVEAIIINFRDISETKKAEESLKESEERYRVFINSTKDMAFLKDNEFRYILVNKANAKFFQKEISEIIGKNDFELMPEDMAKNCRASDEKALNTETIIISEEIVGDKIYETHKFKVPLLNGKLGIGGYIRDISERKWAEENLRKSEEHYRTLLTAIPDLMFRLDKEGRFIDYHTEDTSILFAPPEKFIGKKYREILPPEIADKYEITIKRIKKTGGIGKFEYEAILPNKEKHFYEARITCYGDECVTIIRDITEQKNAEKALIESENKYRSIFENVQDVFYRLDINGVITEISPSVERYIDLTREEIIGKSADVFYAIPEERDKFLKEIYEKEKVSDYELLINIKDGEARYASVNAHLLFDSDKNPIGIEGALRDITERKKSEKKLKESEERFRVLIESMSEGVLRGDENDTIMFVNKRACEMFGYEPEELLGRIGYEVLVIEEDRHIIIEKNKLRIKSKSDTYEVRGRKKNGEIIWLSVNGAPIKDEKGKVIGSVGILSDITHRKKSEEIIKESEERFRKLFEDSPFGIALVSSDLKFLKVNKGFCEMMGYTEKELNSMTFKEITHPDYLANDLKNVKKLFDGEISLYNTEKRYFRKDNSIKWGEVNVTLVKNNKGDFLYLLAMIEDITARKIAEEAVKESEEHFKNIVRNAEAAYFRINLEGLFEEVNNSWLHMHKFESADEIIGKHFVATQLDDDIEKAKEIVKEMLNGKPIETGEFSRRCKDGSVGYHTYSISPVIANGVIVGIEGFLIDTTEKKKTLEALKASQERYRILIETMNEGVILVDNKDEIQFINKSACDIYGYEPEELIGKIGYQILVAEEDRHIILEKNESRLKSVSDSYEIRGLKKNGELIWLNINGAPVKDKEGKIVGSVGIMIDITERKQADEELKKLSRAVEQSPASIVITDIKGNIEYVNPKFVSLTGYLPEEVIGKNPRVLKSGETPDIEYKKMWNTIIDGKDWIGEFHNRKKNGELYWESAIISPVKNSDGKITHFLAIKEDITDKKQKEIELIHAKEKAEESERLKSSFLANMSHELRTPMVGILGFAELMKDMAENPELKDFADNITKSGKRLLETLNLILDLSRIEAGKLDIKASEVDVVQLTNEVYKNYILEAEKKKLKIYFSAPKEQIICKLDERMLWESINNLINNAIKYTKAGEIKVEISTDIKKRNVLIKVKDTGIGIPKESMNTIFEEFRQVSEGYSRGFEGTGLGLTITKNFIEKNGGKISVESEIGIGSVFTIALPILKLNVEEKTSKTFEKDITDEKPLLGKKDIHLLCVDDDSFTREYLEYILKDIYEISFAENGYTAIDMAKTKKFSLILMDINLGKGMDGIETTRKISMLPGYENTPVIAMTAFAMKGDKEEFLNSGMCDYISKPFKSVELIKLIERFIK